VAGSRFCSGTAYINAYDAYAEPSRAESLDWARLVLNGDNMTGLCDPSNLLFEYSFCPPRSDALFSNYFEDLLRLVCARRQKGGGAKKFRVLCLRTRHAFER